MNNATIGDKILVKDAGGRSCVTVGKVYTIVGYPNEANWCIQDDGNNYIHISYLKYEKHDPEWD